jgi:hypothetical protein
MADLDALAPNYRRAVNRWPDARALASCHEALSVCFDRDAHGLVEHIKSFIESVCLTILTEFREPMPSSTPSITELLVAALRPLGLQSTKGASKLNKVLSGFNKLTDALSEMRNEHGVVAHGKDAFLDAVTSDHARAFVHTGDAILSVLLNALEGKQPDLTVTRERYEHFPHHNERIDRAVSVTVRVEDEDGDGPIVVIAVTAGGRNESFEIRAQPSRLLYGIDRAAYIDVLKNAAAQVVAVTAEQPTTIPVVPDVELTKASAAAPVTELVSSYTGRLAAQHVEFEKFLIAEGWLPASATPTGASLTDSLLATADQNTGLDWKSREALQARLRMACKRVLVQFGFDAARADDGAKRLVTWMRSQLPDVD